MQRDDVGRDVAVPYASHGLYRSEKPYPEMECPAAIWALEDFRAYVEGLNVNMFTDHSNFCWLMSRPNPSGRLARWSLHLRDFDFSVVHRPAEQNNVTDALSRNPLPTVDSLVDLVPDYRVYRVSLHTAFGCAGRPPSCATAAGGG